MPWSRKSGSEKAHEVGSSTVDSCKALIGSPPVEAQHPSTVILFVARYFQDMEPNETRHEKALRMWTARQNKTAELAPSVVMNPTTAPSTSAAYQTPGQSAVPGRSAVPGHSVVDAAKPF